MLDPFAGSGTTLVQANELSINSIGYDISAFNVLLTRAKTNPYDLNNVRSEIFDILEKVQQTTQAEACQPSLWATNGGETIGSGGKSNSHSDYLQSYLPTAT